MASVANEDRARFKPVSIAEARVSNAGVSNASISKVPPPLLLSNQARLQHEDGKRRTPMMSAQSQSSKTNRRGSKRRVSDSTPGWNPIIKKRPRSEGDTNTARTLRFSPYALPVQHVQKSQERSLETVRNCIFAFGRLRKYELYIIVYTANNDNNNNNN